MVSTNIWAQALNAPFYPQWLIDNIIYTNTINEIMRIIKTNKKRKSYSKP